MRPVGKGLSPVNGDYSKYEDAKPDLVSRLGLYCSYCERKIPTNLAVEHIEPKGGNFGNPDLEKRWSNFLLACVNCNSSKGSKEVILNKIFLPDRDNTFYAFEYFADGNISSSTHLNISNKNIAKSTLSLLGLDKKIRRTFNAKGKQIALDKVSQRIEVWGIAEEALIDYKSALTIQAVKNQIVNSMKANGFFSIWMKIFDTYPEMKNLFIDAMNGTRESGCFDVNGNNITPHPNLDNLTDGGKV